MNFVLSGRRTSTSPMSSASDRTRRSSNVTEQCVYAAAAAAAAAVTAAAAAPVTAAIERPWLEKVPFFVRASFPKSFHSLLPIFLRGMAHRSRVEQADKRRSDEPDARSLARWKCGQ